MSRCLPHSLRSLRRMACLARSLVQDSAPAWPARRCAIFRRLRQHRYRAPRHDPARTTGRGPVIGMYEALCRSGDGGPADWSPAIAADRRGGRFGRSCDRPRRRQRDARRVRDRVSRHRLGTVRAAGLGRGSSRSATPPFQRIRKSLLDAAKAWARDRGAAWLELESGSARVDAHRFYERERPAAGPGRQMDSVGLPN